MKSYAHNNIEKDDKIDAWGSPEYDWNFGGEEDVTPAEVSFELGNSVYVRGLTPEQAQDLRKQLKRAIKEATSK